MNAQPTRNGRNRNRREQAAPAANSELEPQVQDAPATPADDAPVQEPQVTPEAPAVDDAPAQVQEADAPAAPATPDAPEDAPASDGTDAPGTEGEGGGDVQGPAEERREPTAAELLAYAASTDATVQQEARETAFVQAAGMMLRSMLARVAALPDDQPLTGDWTRLYISGANGRGVAAAKAALQVVVAMFGAGYYEGSTHDSIKADANRGYRKMQVVAFLPDLFKDDFALLMSALNDEGGVIHRLEEAKRDAQAKLRKERGGLPAGVTDYQWMNVASRNLMVARGAEIAARISAMFPADDEQVAEIRKVIAASVAATVLQPGGKKSHPYTATAKYVAPAPVLVGAQA